CFLKHEVFPQKDLSCGFILGELIPFPGHKNFALMHDVRGICNLKSFSDIVVGNEYSYSFAF
ncbi:unnamed protein product, partial [marine sediment metagenome]